MNPSPNAIPVYTVITAGAILLLYIGLTVAMIIHFAPLQAGSPVWERAMVIYNGVTAFAMAAGGVLLGTQIQQTNVTVAQGQAAAAKTEAEKVKDVARNALGQLQSDIGGGAATEDVLRNLQSQLVKAL